MGTRLKNILHVIDLAPQSQIVIPHLLNQNGLAVPPDIVFVPDEDFKVTPAEVTDTSVTIFNDGSEPITGDILVEHWHTLERDFGSEGVLELAPQPYIVVGGGLPGQAPQPPFTPYTRIVIYARTTGSDATGDGTLANPYRTRQHARRFIPPFVPPNVRYVVDSTGLGVEVFPPGYTDPPFLAAEQGDLDFDNFPFTFSTAVNDQATPQLVASIPPADAIINFADVVSVVQDPNSGISTITIAVPRASWAADALKGKLFSGASFFEGAAIVASTATTLKITLGFTPTFPAQILEPSVIFQGSPADFRDFHHGSFNIFGVACHGMGGIEIRPDGAPGPFTFRPGLQVTGVSCAFFTELCVLENPQFQQSGFVRPFNGTVLIGSDFAAVYAQFTNLAVENVFLWNTFKDIAPGQNGLIIADCPQCLLLDSVSDGNTIEGVSQLLGGFAPPVFGTQVMPILARCEVLNAVGDGVVAWGRAGLENVNINGSAGEAFSAKGPGLSELRSVKGAANGGVGVKANNGAQVQVDTDTAVTGVGGDYKAGDLAAAAWPHAVFSKYDITAVGAGGATGTGARVFQPT